MTKTKGVGSGSIDNRNDVDMVVDSGLRDNRNDENKGSGFRLN